MPSPPDVGVVIVAAGRGLRAGQGEAPKQFRPVAGVPLLLRALRPFLSHPAVAVVVAVLPPGVPARPPGWLAELAGDRLRLVEGGAERMDSVARGLEALGPGFGVVVVHDGARPFPDPGVIDAVIAEARAGRPAIAALPVTDTLKEAARDERLGRVVARRTVPREGIWRAQTPQAFPGAVLGQALARCREAGVLATDDAAMVERLGMPVVLVPDAAHNLKVTTADDFLLADALARVER